MTTTVVPQAKPSLDLSKFKPSDIFEHLEYLYDTVIEMRPQLIVELGVRGGESTRAFAEACKDIELEGTPPKFISVDILDCQRVCNYQSWVFIQGDDRAFHIKSQIDILFIDTSHEYAHTITELQLYADRISAGGKIILHDTAMKEVYDAIEYFLKTSPIKFTFENKTNCNGLGTLTRIN